MPTALYLRSDFLIDVEACLPRSEGEKRRNISLPHTIFAAFCFRIPPQEKYNALPCIGSKRGATHSNFVLPMFYFIRHKVIHENCEYSIICALTFPPFASSVSWRRTHQVCVWVDSTTEGKDAPSRSGPFCFEGPQQQLPMDGLGVGSHRCVALPCRFNDRRCTVAPDSPVLSEIPTWLVLHGNCSSWCRKSKAIDYCY